jgi:hypothetical protein
MSALEGRGRLTSRRELQRGRLRAGSWRARSLLVAALLALSLVAEACSSASTGSVAAGANESVSFVIAAHRLGPLSVDPSTSYRQMLRSFATPASSTFQTGECRLRFRKIGLFVDFMTLDPARKGTPATCTLSFAVVTAPVWHTVNGLRVGSTLRSLRRAFPRAFDAGKVSGAHWGIPTGSTKWELTAASGSVAQPILVAYVGDGHVTALGITIVGH